ncbi:MAG: YihY/virulence factor BrkB family protein [Pirellulaceae bacterium]|nr:YihY/virulence factor BrkB family protein [Pirellulaceae bacterium]
MASRDEVDALSVVGLSRGLSTYVAATGGTVWLALKRWQRDDVFSLSAAVSYYMALSLFPMMLLLTGGLGLAMRYSKLGNDAHQQILAVAAEHCSPSLEAKVRDVLDEFQQQSHANGPIGVLSTLLAAIGVFYQFERAFDKIWRLPPPPKLSWLRTAARLLRRRLSAFFLLAAVGGTIFSVFLTNMAIAGLSRWLSHHHRLAAVLLSSTDSIVTISLNALAFAAVYRWLPKRPVQTRVAIRAGLLVAVVWEVGRQVLSAIVVGNRYTTAYGAIGSFIGLLLWFYWGVALLLFGAEYVYVLSRRHDHKVDHLVQTTDDQNEPPKDSELLEDTRQIPTRRLAA